MLAELAIAPVQPWDALVCTARAAAAMVNEMLRAEEERLAERLGATRFPRPLLPVIPLGVDTHRFAAREDWDRRGRGGNPLSWPAQSAREGASVADDDGTGPRRPDPALSSPHLAGRWLHPPEPITTFVGNGESASRKLAATCPSDDPEAAAVGPAAVAVVAPTDSFQSLPAGGLLSDAHAGGGARGGTDLKKPRLDKENGGNDPATARYCPPGLSAGAGAHGNRSAADGIQLGISQFTRRISGKLDRFDSGVHHVSPMLRSKLRHVAGAMYTTSANTATPIAHHDYITCSG
jgi:hypothetical protein